MAGYYERSYGHAGALAAILVGIAVLLLENKCSSRDHNLESINWVVVVVGIVLFALSFFNLAGTLYEIRIIFLAAVIGLVVLCVASIYAAVLSLSVSCGGGYGSNVFASKDVLGIIVFLLNVFGTCFIVSATGAFSRRLDF